MQIKLATMLAKHQMISIAAFSRKSLFRFGVSHEEENALGMLIEFQPKIIQIKLVNQIKILIF